MKRVIVNDFNKNTHQIKAFRKITDKYMSEFLPIQRDIVAGSRESLCWPFEIAIDPFARDCMLAYPHTNDINPDTQAVHNLDALEFLRSYEYRTFDVGLLDPPFSDRMSKDKYGTSNLYASDSKKMRSIELQLGNLIKHGGVIIKFGYNTSKPHPGFECEEVEIWNLGACRNDILVSVWRKTVTGLWEEW